MQINLKKELPAYTQIELLIILADKKQVESGHLKSVFKKYIPELDADLTQRDFKADFLQQILVYPGNNVKIRRLLLMGLGEENRSDHDHLRTAAYHSAKKAGELEVKTAHFLFSSPNSITEDEIQALVEGLYYQDYSFSYKNDEEKPLDISFLVYAGRLESSDLEQDILHRMQGVKLARDLANQPANVLTPAKFAADIKEEFKNINTVKVDIFDEKYLQDHNFNALLSVARGSREKPYLIKMHYIPKKKSTVKIAFVGKGITFDSGGISIKPALNMEEMKFDMAGGAAVSGVMKYISLIKPDAEIIGMIPAVENMPGGSAIKPGDIVKAYNGKTIEIINTDAEGRLILADTLAYVCDQFQPDLIIDLATLTGSVIVTLADKMAGMFTEDDEIAGILETAGAGCAERVWRLPLSDLFKKQLESKSAHIKNVGSRWGGAATAALFLKEFIQDTRWVHLDIAGVANDIKDIDYLPHGATGYGVRLLIDALPALIQEIKNPPLAHPR